MGFIDKIMKEDRNCPFCNLEPGRETILENKNVYAIYDKYPVNRGHALVIPRKHVADYFDLSEQQQLECWRMVNDVKQILE